MNGLKEFGKGHTLASVLDEVWCDGDNRMEADRELAADFFNDSEVGGNQNRIFAKLKNSSEDPV